MLEVADALAAILDRATTLSPVEFALSSDVLGRVLGEAVASDLDSPPFDKSLMDGYAVGSADGLGPFEVIEEVPAGRMPTKVVGRGQASRVMTGAPIPAGADAVVPHERTTLEGTTVRLQQAPPAGQFILERAREMAAGEIILPAGTVLTPQTLGLLAAVGRTSARVHPAATLSVISTGDELVEPPHVPGPGRIRNSNGPMLLAQAIRAGAIARYLGIAADDRDRLADLVRQGLESDVLVLSGGVSAGKFDFVPGVLQDLGVETHFHKVRMKPGKPLLFGTRHDTLVFGLPGNPASSFVGFELFVRSALRKIAGHPAPAPVFGPIPLAGELALENDRPTFAPGRMEWFDGPRVRPLASFGSADLRSLVQADALIRLPAGVVHRAAGQTVSTLVL